MSAAICAEDGAVRQAQTGRHTAPGAVLPGLACRRRSLPPCTTRPRSARNAHAEQRRAADLVGGGSAKLDVLLVQRNAVEHRLHALTRPAPALMRLDDCAWDAHALACRRVFGARPLAQGAAAQRARCQAAGSTAGERGGWGHAQTWSPEIVSLKSMSSTIHFWNSFTFAMLFHTTRSTVWEKKKCK